MMDDTDQQYYSMEFIEEEGKTFVIFFNQEGELVAKREIPHRDITEENQAERERQLTSP
jgi:hypothetical protein